MALEEQRAWIMALVAVAGYTAYLVIVLGRLDSSPVSAVAYVGPLVTTVILGIVAGIVLHIAASVVTPAQARRTDERDRAIGRFGEYTGHSFVVVGAVAALVLAMAEVDHFWIANAVYLAFVLSALLSSVAKIAAYRFGFPQW